MLSKGDRVRYTSPFYPDIWVEGIIGEDVFLDRQMNSGHGMWWEPSKWFFDKNGNLRNIEKL